MHLNWQSPLFTSQFKYNILQKYLSYKNFLYQQPPKWRGGGGADATYTAASYTTGNEAFYTY